MSIPAWQCPCCHLPVGAPGPYCVRCGYPLELTLEEQYLQASMTHLQRELRFNSLGEKLRVLDLLRMQQARFAQIQQTREVAHSVHTEAPDPSLFAHAAGTETPDPGLSAHAASEGASGNAAPGRSARPAISLASFFADQSINIVASLGAFLILIGSLSFIVTTSDLLLSFLVLLVVHALFGAIGSVTFRIARLRVISVIYTAIFALQVPLVAFSAFRWLSNNTQLPSTSVLITMAAVYAMVTYGMLALYQRFKPFGYLAALSCLVALSALPSVVQLPYWWYGAVYLGGALALSSWLRRKGALPLQSQPGQFSWEILREPALVLMYVCTFFSVLALMTDVLVSQFGVWGAVDRVSVRLAIVTLLCLLIVWVSVCAVRTLRYGWLNWLPALGISLVLALTYLVALPFTGYILVLTLCVALAVMLYWRFRDGFLRSVPGLSAQLLVLALVIVSVLPLMIDPWLFYQFDARVHNWSYGPTTLINGSLPVDLFVLLFIGLLLGWLLLVQRPGQDASRIRGGWQWLLLFPAAILSYAYGLVLVVGGLSPIPWLFVLPIIWVGVTGLLCRLLGRSWLAPGLVWTLIVLFIALSYALTPLTPLQQYTSSIIAVSLGLLILLGTEGVWGLLRQRTHFALPSPLVKTSAIIGQCIVLLIAVSHDGFFLIYPRVLPGLVHLHVFVLAVLGIMLLVASWPGRSQQRSREQWFCLYAAMVVLSWIPMMELAALGIMDMTVLYLSPGLVLLLLSVLVSHNEHIVHAHTWSQWCAILSACFLLGPALVFSFQQQSIQSSLILGGEALLLLLLALFLRARVLLLCGIAVVIVTAVHTLFLPSLGIPSFLALSLTGLCLLLIATLMLIVRPRLAVLWAKLD